MNDWFQRMAVLHLLQLHSQVFIDIAQTLLSNMGQSVEGYRDSIRKLKELKLIDEDEMRFLLSVVGFRNVLIHEYARVNLGLVDRILKSREYRKVLEIALKIREKAGNYWDC
ncbi:MAG: type VII toxin-antitoxin system HepT family RNase toxin [Thermoprotei archaeon]